jgi:bifunctional non-homologous end joining protein LigD
VRVATWNVNNVLKRLDQLLAWLERTTPDVVALQELKAPTDAFPVELLRRAGYESIIVGQRSWNGVALLARGHTPVPVLKALPGDSGDKEARYVEAAIDGVLYACLYLPNGNPCPGPKFDHKLAWFERLRARAQSLWATGQPVVLLGDWNVVPTDEDIYKPDTWRDDALLQPEPRAAFASILAQGWTDALKAVPLKTSPFTFWDYRRKRWERDAGLRIDHILTSAALKVLDAGVDREERGRESPSDHAPVWAELSLAKGPGRRRQKVDSPPLPKRGKSAAKPPPTEALALYNAKRDFAKTQEPSGEPHRRKKAKGSQPLSFVIQKHWASRLHYDFRLEFNGVLMSWAVPKGPSFDPAVKQMAIQVEDHPVSYGAFEGKIPARQYGAGDVIVWDNGTWEPTVDPVEGLAKGKLIFKLHGQKLAGLWELVRISKPGTVKPPQWLLLKKRGDAWCRPQSEYDVITALPDSVIKQPLGPVEDREPRDVPPSRQHTAQEAPDLSGARKAKLPDTLAPQLATLTAAAPQGDWVVEPKWDGYRILARLDGGDVRLLTRNGHDWTHKLPALHRSLVAMSVNGAWLDGEIVVMGEDGVPNFNMLQNAMDRSRSDDVRFYAFDVPFLGGMDLREVPLRSRRELVRKLLEESPQDNVFFSESFDVPASQLLEAACNMRLEGVMLKQADSTYATGRRSESWLKLKCQQRQEFVVVGYSLRKGTTSHVGSIMLGYHADGELKYAGSCGTGWDTEMSAVLYGKLHRLESDTPAVDPETVKPGRWGRRTEGKEIWVKPKLVVEVSFAEWTPDGSVRQATFKGIRSDKAAKAISREVAKPVANPPQKALKPGVGIKVTNPDRVIDPSTGIRKIELVHYYESIAPWILPHLKDRPVSLVRAPTGITGQLFFQKHPESKVPGLRELDATLWPGHAPLMVVDSIQALLSAAQMNVVEFHTWNSVARQIDTPDRVVFDLDPGEGVGWKEVQEAADLMRALLLELGLESWLKTSGGKGLHVVVPLAPKLPYEVVKGFSQAAVQHMAKTIPSRFVAKSGGTNRVGKIFIDYLRNGHGQTTAAAFSARARPGMGVSMPVSWSQLTSLKSGAQWTIRTAREYLSFQTEDPWAEFWTRRQALGKPMKALGFKPK